MSKLLVLPYKSSSKSAVVIANELGCKRMNLTNSRVVDNPNTSIINWGNSTTNLSHLPSVKVYNVSENVRLASHKLDFFKAITQYNDANQDSPVSIPDWTSKVSVARRWYTEGNDVVVRNVMQGHSGDGLELISYDESILAKDAVPKAPLYTKYIKKRDEYRVHVVGREAIFLQRKAPKYSDSRIVDYQIRNASNGFIFVTEGLTPNPLVESEAVKAVVALGLDFGAVDVIWNERRGKATVIEVNTACGLTSNKGIERYKRALESMLINEAQIKWNQVLPINTYEEMSEDLNTMFNEVQARNTFLRRTSQLLTSSSFNEMITNDSIGCSVLLSDVIKSYIIDYVLAGGTENGANNYHTISELSDRACDFELYDWHDAEDTCRVLFFPRSDDNLRFHIELDLPSSQIHLVEC